MKEINYKGSIFQSLYDLAKQNPTYTAGQIFHTISRGIKLCEVTDERLYQIIEERLKDNDADEPMNEADFEAWRERVLG